MRLHRSWKVNASGEGKKKTDRGLPPGCTGVRAEDSLRNDRHKTAIT